jgi:phosphoribosylamine--glycine ligase
MGSYKDTGDILPFLNSTDRERELEIVDRIFENWKRRGSSALRGIPLYLAFMHTKDGVRILENNSRPGDPEIINILPILKDDFVDVCFRMLEGNLTKLDVRKAATVVTYKVPPNYGGYADMFPALVNRKENGGPVDLTGAYKLHKKYGQDIRVYPGSMEQRDGATYALKSRAVCVVGVGNSIEEARSISLEGIEAIRGGGLWNRTDIASEQHVRKSTLHMKELRRNR